MPEWLARGRRGDRGFTLVEVLMVLLLFGIVSAIVAAVTTSGLHHQRELQDRSDALASARTAMQRIDRDIRSTSQIDYATSSELLMQEPLYTGTTVTGSRWVCYYTRTVGTATTLVQDVNTASDVCPSTPSTLSKVLVSNVTNSDASPLFSFSPVTSYAAPSGSSVDASTCAMSGTSPAAYDPSCIGTVTVHILTQPSSLSGPVSVSDNGTELRNVQ
jgi:prepilin-type N-terminal cleavage/methylation domain-containing protein